MYSSLEIIELEEEGYTVVFTHPAGFTHLAQAGLHTELPLLLPHAMEVFADHRDFQDYVWDTAGRHCPFIDVSDLAFQVSGVTSLGMDARDRLLGSFTLRQIYRLPYSTDYVLAEVGMERPERQRFYLLFPAALVARHGPGTVVWGVFDRVRDIADVPTEQILASTHPNLIFRVVLALSRGDRELWDLMLELGESASTIIGAVQLAEDEGYRVITDDGPPMRFSLHDPAYRQTHVDPESSTGRAGKDVRGIPMDEPAYHNLLAILERVMDTPEMMADEKLMHQVNQFLALVMAAAPRRVLARHHGFAEISLGAARELDWEDIESWIAEQPPEEEAAERQFLLEPGQAVDSQVLATLHRACEDHSLLRVELKKAAPVVLEARKIGYSWTTERQLQGFDQASGQELKLGVLTLYSVEYLGMPWGR